MKLGELIGKLEKVQDKTVLVFFDFEYARPTQLMSWRGSYNQLAVGFDFESESLTVRQFLNMLNGAIGKTYQGYKGGDFVMDKDTSLWVSNYGNAGETTIVGIIDGGFGVILETRHCEYNGE